MEDISSIESRDHDKGSCFNDDVFVIVVYYITFIYEKINKVMHPYGNGFGNGDFEAYAYFLKFGISIDFRKHFQKNMSVDERIIDQDYDGFVMEDRFGTFIENGSSPALRKRINNGTGDECGINI
ncbi:hypothetical protein GLI01_32830 [Gluconacetobacter liquefaciens]|nr:hypothetical protein AA0522_2360 [Gluconacetobacter liquefaciens NRIC 0522]GEB39248.1 hypothetical protein GLI01_32830 [Gluconacetobacter liquefaciens]